MSREDDGPRAPRIASWQLRQLIYVARTALDDLEQGVMWPKDEEAGRRLNLTAVELLERSQATGRAVTDAIGYPTSTRPGAGHSIGVAANPVAATATALPSTLLRQAARTVVYGLEEATANLQQAVGALLQVAPPDPPLEPISSPPPGCKSCERVGQFSPVDAERPRTARCKWCYDWLLAHRADPPIEILQAHHRGERITTRFANAIAAAAPAKRRARR